MSGIGVCFFFWLVSFLHTWVLWEEGGSWFMRGVCVALAIIIVGVNGIV